jgi:hypothetical protein
VAELTEAELLLLDNFMYFDISTRRDATVGNLLDEIRNPDGSFDLDAIKFGGGISDEEVQALLSDMVNSETLSSLRIAQSTNDDGIRASCFVDADGNATVAFRGTGGTMEAWKDNVQGENVTDTDMQEAAARFVSDDCGAYSDITVTGHSKGGNLAQYVTVTEGDRIDRCVSYDGQGFSDKFIEKYADEIEAYSGKIKSISAYNDYVNILLTPIAGTVVYLENTGTGLEGHYPSLLYFSNTCDPETGEYTSTRGQSEEIKLLKAGTDTLVAGINLLGDDEETLVTDILGSFVGFVMAGHDLKELGSNLLSDACSYISDKYRDFTSFVSGLFGGKKESGRHAAASCRFSASIRGLEAGAADLQACAASLRSRSSEIEKIRARICGNILSGIAVGLPLSGVMKRLKDCAADADRIAKVLSNGAETYRQTEQSILNRT